MKAERTFRTKTYGRVVVSCDVFKVSGKMRTIELAVSVENGMPFDRKALSYAMREIKQHFIESGEALDILSTHLKR